MDDRTLDWIQSLPPLPAMRTCPDCGQYSPDIADFWLAGEASCRGCVVRRLLADAGHVAAERTLVNPEGHIIGIDGTAL